ncbi:hypothetical protein [Mesorhizobium sp. B2-8-9]|uniref:bestrophin-like domain n=1 Tax=Mesorhizobium sp. B2-8-9 TaxID=2589899 RepID=UPI0032B1A23F
MPVESSTCGLRHHAPWFALDDEFARPIGKLPFPCAILAMGEMLVGAAIFACLAGASLVSLMVHERFPAHHLQDDTSAVVRLAANLFVVMSSLMLGLMINSAKNTFEAINGNVHTFATDLILLDRTLRHY